MVNIAGGVLIDLGGWSYIDAFQLPHYFNHTQNNRLILSNPYESIIPQRHIAGEIS
jgi:hypothetical protein